MLVHLVLTLSIASGILATPFLGQLIKNEEQLLAEYDFVIAGGGTAVSSVPAIDPHFWISLDFANPNQQKQGLVVANRLTEDPKGKPIASVNQ